MPQPLVTLTFHLLTLKVVSESHVTWATSVPILVFLGLSALDLGPMYIIIVVVVVDYGRRRMPLCPHLLQLVINIYTYYVLRTQQTESESIIA